MNTFLKVIIGILIGVLLTSTAFILITAERPSTTPIVGPVMDMPVAYARYHIGDDTFVQFKTPTGMVCIASNTALSCVKEGFTKIENRF